MPYIDPNGSEGCGDGEINKERGVGKTQRRFCRVIIKSHRVKAQEKPRNNKIVIKCYLIFSLISAII